MLIQEQIVITSYSIHYTKLYDSASAYNNKWANVAVSFNTVQTYIKEGATNNSITISNDKWYVMNWLNSGYVDTKAIFMELSAEPVDIV